MKTRSGQVYYSDKCYICKEYYAYNKFNNLCSECCCKKYPNKMKSKNMVLSKYHIDKTDEYNLITDNTIPETNGLYKYLISNLKKHSGKNTIETHVAEMLFMICFTAKKGISAKQATLIYQLTGTIGKSRKTYNKDYKFQHFLGGFIYDYWNIRTINNGSIAECYYGQYKPLKEEINDIRIPPVLIPISSSEWKRNRTMVERYKFWYRNIPEELKHCNM